MADSTSTTTTSAASYLLPYYQQFLQQSSDTANRPFQQYTGQRVADPTSGQTGAANYYQNAMNGQYNITAATNPYAGANPYLDQSIASAQQDVADGYNMLQAPAWASAMLNSGSFGNSGVQQAQAYDMGQVAKQQANIAQNMRMQDYTQQQQLGEDQANRNMQAQQFNSTLGQTAASGALTAGNQLYNINQNQLGAQQDQWNEQWNYPLQQLDILGNALRTGMGSGSTTTSYTPVSTNSTGQIIGGTAALAGLLGSSPNLLSNIGSGLSSIGTGLSNGYDWLSGLLGGG